MDESRYKLHSKFTVAFTCAILLSVILVVLVALYSFTTRDTKVVDEPFAPTTCTCVCRIFSVDDRYDDSGYIVATSTEYINGATMTAHDLDWIYERVLPCILNNEISNDST